MEDVYGKTVAPTKEIICSRNRFSTHVYPFPQTTNHKTNMCLKISTHLVSNPSFSPYPFSQSLATWTHVTMSSFCHKNLFFIMEVQRPLNGPRKIEFKSYFIECFGGWRFSLVYINLGHYIAKFMNNLRSTIDIPRATCISFQNKIIIVTNQGGLAKSNCSAIHSILLFSTIQSISSLLASMLNEF